MVTKAYSKPSDSEELLALGQYMVYVSTTFVEEMSQTIRDLTVVACDISRFATLPKKFWHAQTASIRWIQNIGLVIFKHSTLHETGKQNADEALKKAIDELNDELNRFEPNLTFLDRMDDIGKLDEYKLVM